MNRFKSLFMSWIFPWVPKRLMSRLTGVLMQIPLPRWLAGSAIRAFAVLFSIDVSQAEKAPSEYRSLDDFFTRKLKSGLRTIDGRIVHPVDGRLTERGRIVEGQLVQAKGWNYPLVEFLGSPELVQAYTGGSFMTYYLCPADYHRVHAPANGRLVSARHIPGLLWPVNHWSVNNIRRLFCLNERVVLNFVSDLGRWSLVMVGATNVGKMSITLDPSIATNRWLWHAPTDRHYSPPPAVTAGDELGKFHLGSTVICLFEADFNLHLGGEPMPVLMGQKVMN